MIEVKKIYKAFNHKVILDEVNLKINEGEALAIIGPSGCGKTTLLKIILGLTWPNSGEVLLDGESLFKLDQNNLDRVRLKCGLVFQYAALFDSLTVGENVAFGLREHSRLSETEIQRTIDEKLELVGLPGTKNLFPDELSGGMKKRVGIARAIAHNPKIILYDEPTTGLDPVTTTTIEDLIIKLHRELKVTTVLVTHQLTTVFHTCQRIVMLEGGKLIETGSPEETKSSEDARVRNFIKSSFEL